MIHPSIVRPEVFVSLVTETFDPDINGVAMTLAQLHASLLASGHHVQVICPRADEPRDLPDCLEVPGVALPFYKAVRFGFPMRGRLLRNWRAQRPDLVHIATEGPLGLAALQAARRLGIPVTSSLHTNFHTYMAHYRLGWLTRPVMAYLRWFHNRTALTFIPTDQQASVLAAMQFERLVVLGRGVDTKLFTPTRRDEGLRQEWRRNVAQVSDNDALVALHVGRLAAEKNLDLLVTSLEAMRATRPDLLAVVVGDGPERARLERALPWVRFVGMKRGEVLARHYASADLFVFPSKSETFGNVVLEAMASGLSCISFNYAAGSRLIQDGISGYLVDWDDDEGFVRTSVDATIKRQAEMGEQARKTAAEFDWGLITRSFEHHLLMVLESNGSPVLIPEAQVEPQHSGKTGG